MFTSGIIFTSLLVLQMLWLRLGLRELRGAMVYFTVESTGKALKTALVTNSYKLGTTYS